MPASRNALPSLLAAVALAAATEAAAAELSNLDADLPTAVDDALASAPGRFELQGAARYDRVHGRDAVQLLPRVQLGVVQGFQVNLALPCTVGSGRREDPGRSGGGGGLLYNFNRERDWLPAFAVALDYGTPVGSGRQGAEVGLAGIATKTISPAVDRRLNLNVAWLRALSPDEEERRDRCRVIAGCSQLVASNVVVVLALHLGKPGAAGTRRQHRKGRAAPPVHRCDYPGRRRRVRRGPGSPRFRALAGIQIGFGGP